MTKSSLNPKEVVELLSKLKSVTPEYPDELMVARRAAFIKQAVSVKLGGKGQGGESGQQGGSGSGAASGGVPAFQGILWQAVIGFLVVAAMLLGAYLYRNYLGDLVDENEVPGLVESSIPLIDSTLTPSSTIPTPSPIATPTFVTSTPTIIDNVPATGLENHDITGVPDFIGTPGATNENSGLHLGQTPGTPAAPGQGNPGNENKPDKPTKEPKPKNTKEPNKK